MLFETQVLIFADDLIKARNFKEKSK